MDRLQPEDLFRKEFKLIDQVASEQLYITCQGVYEAEFNGRRVGDHFLAPGWTSYESRLQYQTYDVTSLLRAGEEIALALESPRAGLLAV